MSACRGTRNFIIDFMQLQRVVLEISRRCFEVPVHGFATVCDYIYSCASHFIFILLDVTFWLFGRYLLVCRTHELVRFSHNVTIRVCVYVCMFSAVKGEAIDYKVVVRMGLGRVSSFTRQFSGASDFFLDFNRAGTD